jgi:capsid protein
MSISVETPGAKMTLLERAVSVVSPKRAVAMAQSRFMVNFAGQYAGARTDKTSLRNFRPMAGSADADSIGDLQTLRARSRDLARNTPIARGARNTSKTNVVGHGLRLRSKVDRDLLGISEDQAEAWESRIETLFHLWARSKNADVARRLNFYQQQALAFTSAWDSGDMFALRRYKEGTSFIALCVQLLEADRVSTPVDRQNEYYLRDGVEINDDGEVVAYHVLNRHPGDSPTRLAALAGGLGQDPGDRPVWLAPGDPTARRGPHRADARRAHAGAGYRGAQATGPLRRGGTYGRGRVGLFHGLHQDRRRRQPG